MAKRKTALASALCAVVWAALLLTGCSSTRHVAKGSFLLDKVSITVEDSADIATKKLHNYLRQQPNHKILGFAKLQLGVYNLSGRDSTSRFNRWLRKIGEEPVIYDETLTDQSARQLRQALINAGFNNARVEVETTSPKEKKINVAYRLYPGQPHVVSEIAYEIDDPSIEEIVFADSLSWPVKTGERLDRNLLDTQRAIITEKMRNNGYFSFNKEYISFIADTVAGSKQVGLTMVVHKPQNLPRHRRYIYSKVTVVTNFSPGDDANDFNFSDRDTVDYRGIEILYGKDRYLTPKNIVEQCYIIPGQNYSTTSIDRTYEALNRLSILRYVNILTRPVGNDGDTELLEAYILLSPTKKMGVTLELEGTNSEGDFGVGGGVTFQHRNLAHGGEMLTAKFRGAYESLSGSLDGLINDNYTEVAAELGITFPKFKAPFLSSSFKQKMRATTEFAVTFMRQERPEYTRIIGGGTWRYKWTDRANSSRRTFDLIDINVVNLPKSTIDFIDHIAPDNPLLRYSYEDHFIMSMGYRYYNSNKRIPSAVGRTRGIQPMVYTIRASAETAGNLLYLGSRILAHRTDDGVYDVFNTSFSQYVKGEVDYALTRNFDHRHSLAFHVGAGIGFPYGNSRVLPFEKRFYAGGANGVRGWGVRTLGPGSYNSHNSVTYFMNQCGDIRFDMSVEYRAKLFWVLEGGAFIDAGNIWTIHNYENQPGGMFHFDTFWKQIAWSYGIGLRMDFNYFLLRLDLGIKAYNPAEGQERWPLFRFNWHRNTAVHFSVGYPF